jgi:RHS repeat-associated protein
MSNLGHRYYQPETGRWVNRDPIEEEAFRHFYLRSRFGDGSYEAILTGCHQTYAFCDNRPTDEADPFGLTNDPGDFGGPVLPPGWDYTPDPPPQFPTPESSGCIAGCVAEHLLGITIETTVIVSGQPVLKKRFVTPGSAEGTSIAGKVTDAILKDAKLPARLPTLTQCCKLTYTKSASRFVSRWIPFVGWAMLTYDVSGLAGCICGCEGL